MYVFHTGLLVYFLRWRIRQWKKSSKTHKKRLSLYHIMGKVHGSLARAGKVRGQTPKVAKQEKPKTPKGRALKRIKYNRRFVTAATLVGGKRRMNPNP
jgi:small subunit ribosomal protein S30e